MYRRRSDTQSNSQGSQLYIRFVPAGRHLKKTSSKRHEKTVLKERTFYMNHSTASKITVGRDNENEFTLDSTAYPKILSKKHCVIVCQHGERLYLMDNGSTNGTLVNGTKVDKRKPMPVPSGSLVVFGGKRSDLAYEVFIVHGPKKRK